MLNARLLSIREDSERESGRADYPQDFPALPPVPVGRYVEQDFYDLEMKHLWPRTWLYAGHASEIPEPGCYKLFEQLGQSVIVSRGEGGEIRAFHNICRHRASALVVEDSGKTRRFVCPYHSWSYDLDGGLIGVPEERDFKCLDKAERGLKRVHCETMRGMIFINLDGNAPPLEEYFASTLRELEGFPLEDMVVNAVISVEMECNWKAALDNFLEAYHINTVHAKSIAPYLDSRSFNISLFRGGHARFATRKRGAGTIFGKDLAIPQGPSEIFRTHTIALPMFPNSFIAVDPVGFGWQSWWPVGMNRTVMTFTLMGWRDDVNRGPGFREAMVEQVKAIANEDVHLFPRLQRSLESGAVSSLLLGYQERALYWYQEEIDRRIGPQNIPQHLRIEQILAPFTAD